MSFYHSPEQINQMDEASFTYDTSRIVPSVPQKLSRVLYPEKKALLAEWLDNHAGGNNTWWSWGGSRNYLFVDGHVEFLHNSKILPANNNLPDINLTKDGISGKDIQ
jgi:prepilin-type processing-associated H-X9-DG protein